ncbi:MAG: UDP-2,3-diacylglucosamine diphosphatase [Bacteroidales bacterium]|jgi:UDP-2,3-diacylglucosamine hydrolase|nr:UDP-2,3-diacylglucosamine diphosphatase [Bacteroidales bacterium]
MSDLFQNPIQINGTVFFASDFHLGSPDKIHSLQRERLIVEWLDEIKKEATHLFLLGDIFDFWFEYHDVVPKGYFLFLSKLAELRASGIDITVFTGNHDMWMKNYLIDELGVTIYRKETAFLINGKRCLIGHGDGLGDGDWGYKIIKILFAFRFNQWLFGWLHPRIAFALARFFSRKSRAMTGRNDEVFRGNEREVIVQYALKMLQKNEIDYFIYGHRHLPLNIALSDTATYLNSGDWLVHNSYLRADELSQQIELCFFVSLQN